MKFMGTTYSFPASGIPSSFPTKNTTDTLPEDDENYFPIPIGAIRSGIIDKEYLKFYKS